MKLQDEDTHKSNHVEEHNAHNSAQQQLNTETKKELPKVQPTSEQLMIAQLIEGTVRDDPKAIQQVMDITGKAEDEVATALHDAGWDQNRAIELLLEGGGGGAWEETGKKKKKKPAADDKVGCIIFLFKCFVVSKINMVFCL